MRRALIATVVGAEAGTEAEVELTIERLSEGRWRVEREGGVGCEVDAREIAPGTWSLLLDGRSLVVDLDHQRSALARACILPPRCVARSSPLLSEPRPRSS